MNKTVLIVLGVLVVGGGLIWYARRGVPPTVPATRPVNREAVILSAAPTVLGAITGALGFGGGNAPHQAASQDSTPTFVTSVG